MSAVGRCACFIGTLVTIIGVCCQPTDAQTPLPSGQRISLQKQLETGLKVRRPQEFAFIARVVALVEQRKLPRQMVQETFVWARRQSGRYPYVHFERALQVRAARIGIDVSPLANG